MTITAFQARVYAATRKIPRGCVTTYGLLARHLNCGSPRAVGQALRRNPFAPEVPCHRVIASNLTLGGFAGQTHGTKIQEKKMLLQREGVSFANGRLADPDQIFDFSLD